jgi:acetylornithine deacetylase
MKAGLLCGLFAAKAIKDAGISLNGKLLIHSVIGEEDGGVGTLATILRGHVADAAIVLEPTELTIAAAQAGALNFRITIPGKAAHGAIRYEGVSAIEKFIPIYREIMAYEKARNEAFNDPMFTDYPIPYPICVGTIQAGVWASTVAESCTFEGRFGIAVGENAKEARQAFEAMVADAAGQDEWLAENPPIVTWWGGQFESAGISPTEPIVQVTSDAFTDITGETPVIKGMPYGADMRLLVNNGGVPTLMFGTRGISTAHQPDEHVPLADLETVTRTLVLAILRFCGVA